MKEYIHLTLILIWSLISLLLIIHLWRRPSQEGGWLKRSFWTLVLLIPVLGWIFYGGFYRPPGPNKIHAQGGASGWGHSSG
ncbi:MAG: hypothetical protein GKR89_09985 [Candidatus Latescibacteria bacterium]|nr:hypothetical protein [Candidatus Latescibacterota bacterium]